MDFRKDAVDASLDIIEKNSLTPWTELEKSLCRQASSNSNQVQYLSEIPLVVIFSLCMLNSLVAPILGLNGLIPFPLAMILLGVGLFLLLTLRKLKAWILTLYLKGREGSFIAEFAELPSRFIGLENSATVKEVKLIIEDQGVCLFDAVGKKIMIEGCAYRYIIQAENIISIKPVSAYALGGAEIKCKIADQELGMVLTVAGHGPISSLIESFYPSHGAHGLAGMLVDTLFDMNQATYEKKLPPPLPKKMPLPDGQLR